MTEQENYMAQALALAREAAAAGEVPVGCVIVRGGEIVGYAYAGPFGSRAAYDWAVEMSIYLREDQRHRGTGKRLYAALEGE